MNKIDVPVETLKRYESEPLSLKDMAKIAGVSYTTVRIKMIQAGIELRSSGTDYGRRTYKKKFVDPSLLNRYREGLTIREIAERAGLSYQKIRNELESAGIPRRSRGGRGGRGGVTA